MSCKNLLEAFDHTVKTRDGASCLRFKEKGKWQTLCWDEVYAKVLDLAGGLYKLGVKKGDRVCILSKSRYEWSLADLAVISCGGITVPIYESSTAEQIAYIINHCEAKVLFVEDANQLKKVHQILGQIPQVKQIILFEPISPKQKDQGFYILEEIYLLGSGHGKNVFESSLSQLTRDSDASYVYTSGTTGPPKGGILTHGNFLTEIESLKQVLPFGPETESLMFLPLAHIFARMLQFAHIHQGFIQCYAESIDKLLDNLAEIRPTMMGSVPRIFEKVHTRVMQGVEVSSSTKKKIFNWALNVGKERSHLILKKKNIPLSLALKWKVAYALVFSKLHKKLGGRIQYFISGGAPLSVEIAEFFHAAGFTILEGYGLTETSAAATVNTFEYNKPGTVGKVVPGVEIKIAKDGEILIKGGIVFKGYYKKVEDTKEALDSDGWFHSGDIGEIDQEGFLKITDRKKDIIVTAGGKNVAPQNIESLIKADPFISQVMVHGDKRKFLSALVTLDKDQVVNYAKDHRIPFQNYSDLIKNEKIHHLVKARIEEKNKQLASYESIKKFAILENDFSVDTGELTPTLKVKRKFTSQKYRDILDQFYAD